MQQSLTKQRFYSLDVFRGATVCLMILVNNPGSWSHIYTPLEHAPWHGVTPTDLVFPFFLFAVGNALAFVMPRLEVAGPSIFWKKVIKRTLLIIYLLKIRGAFIAACVILLGYWLLTVAGNPADPYSLTGWFGANVDKAVLGAQHMYHGESLNGVPIAFDPEGLMSLFGSIVQVMFGYFVGDYIIKRGKTPEMINGLFVGGIVFLFAGYMWDMVFPLNKKIWTSSYTVYTTGMAMVIIATMIYLIELKNKRGWLSKFFDVFGKNPLFIFVLSGMLPRLLGLIRIPNGLTEDGVQNFTTPFAWFYEHICKPIFPNNLNNGSLLYALVMITFYWLIVYWMDKKKIYIKV